MNRVSVGPSTIALIVGAVGAATAFIVGWAETGTAPTWLAGIAAGMAALMAWLRTWQATVLDKQYVIDDTLPDEDPSLPDDFPEAE